MWLTCLVSLVLLVSSFAQAQNQLTEIDLEHIRQATVRQYISEQQDRHIKCFSDLHPSVVQNDALDDFRQYEKVYLIKESVHEVWANYKYASQTDVWEINRVSFGMAFCRDSEEVVYADELLFGMEVGQIYFLNLKILHGLYNLPVAFEVTTVDRERRLFEFSYLKGGKAEGKQSIQLMETPQGYTEIVHKSFVRSDSKFRDKYLYPFFHNKLIREFHSNMRRIITYNAKNPRLAQAGLAVDK
ncbi:MAG: hypothetical protein HC819_07225 [Cyclobacteriaceae bacterium]|nr:hypothetical protein [Cyclobacteriaceae bacterium]